MARKCCVEIDFDTYDYDDVEVSLFLFGDMQSDAQHIVYEETKIRHDIDLVEEYEKAYGVFIDLFSSLKSHSAFSLIEDKKVVFDRPRFKKSFDYDEPYYGKNVDQMQDFETVDHAAFDIVRDVMPMEVQAQELQNNEAIQHQPEPPCEDQQVSEPHVDEVPALEIPEIEPEMQSAIIAQLSEGDILYAPQSPKYIPRSDTDDDQIITKVCAVSNLAVQSSAVRKLRQARKTRWSPLLVSSPVLTSDFRKTVANIRSQVQMRAPSQIGDGDAPNIQSDPLPSIERMDISENRKRQREFETENIRIKRKRIEDIEYFETTIDDTTVIMSEHHENFYQTFSGSGSLYKIGQFQICVQHTNVLRCVQIVRKFQRILRTDNFEFDPP
jgi:hypothetical protein